MTQNEAPEKLYYNGGRWNVTFGLTEFESQVIRMPNITYIRSDIAEARAKDMVQNFANELTYELDKIEGRFMRADLERVHDVVTQLLKEQQPNNTTPMVVEL
jgi:hypothetical protein